MTETISATDTHTPGSPVPPRPETDAAAVRAIEEATAHIRERAQQIREAPQEHKPRLVLSKHVRGTSILDKIAALPAVQSVGLSTTVPMDGNGWHDPIFAGDHVYSESQLPPLRLYRFLSPGLLKTMGNTLVAGRDFTWTDIYGKRPVAMISENLARELWHDPGKAIGRRIRENLNSPWREIVGVVGDERDDGVNQKAPTIAYWPLMMDDFSGNKSFAARGVAILVRSKRTGSSGFVQDISKAVWSVNPDLPLANVRTLREIYDK